jgi:hypothetical protein
MCSISTTVKDDSLKAIQDLEKELGKTLLAYSCHKLKPAGLDKDDLSKITDLEKKLGVVLVAVEA